MLHTFHLRFRTIPTWVILLIPTMFGFLFAFISSWPLLFPTQEEPFQLPAPPVTAVHFQGIEATHFFEANPYIQGIDGQIYDYRYRPETGQVAWQISSVTLEATNPTACSITHQQHLERLAGIATNCQTVKTVGEWCPGDIVSMAFTENGQLWQLIETPPCTFFFTIGAIIYASAGFGLGVMVVLGRALSGIISTFLRKRANNHPSTKRFS